MNTPARPPRWISWLIVAVLAAGVFALRGPTFGFRVWNVDEAIHAAVARTLVEGGVLYRDAIDQRTPLTYHVVALLFRVGGTNNVWAMHVLAAALIVATAAGLVFLGRAGQMTAAGAVAALLFAVFSSALFPPGDAYALHTEWFVAAFTVWAAWAFAREANTTAGMLLGLAFLSKQPALLDLGAPLAVLAMAARGATFPWRRLAALLGGFAAPVLLAAGYFAAHGALGDLHFYAWQYNIAYYGPEVSSADRVASAIKPFQLLAAHYPLVLAAATVAAAATMVRVLQREPAPAEKAGNPALVYLLAWCATALAGAAAGGRGFDHYFIQFLPPLCLVAGQGLAGLLAWARAHRAARLLAPAALVLLAAVLWELGSGVARSRAAAHQPIDPSVRVAEYIRDHTQPADRIFVWGYHPDIYLFADRRPASRFVYASFLSGLIPWSNTTPGRDTSYAVVPGARETLLRELAATRPAFIVDCSAGPNRHWQKYPLDTFPALRDFISANYRLVEAAQFLPQGFRLFQRRPPGVREPVPVAAELPAETAAALAVRLLGPPVPPAQAVVPFGASFSVIDGQAEYFAHAPSRLVYRLPAGTTALRGGFGLRPAAYAADNPAPSDGAEFVVRWRAGGEERVLLRRLLQPRTEAADRGTLAFRVEFPAGQAAELVLEISPGPADNAASDWTYWAGLLLETAR